MHTCRICLEPGGKTFCKCSGTAGHVHEKCLVKWLNVSNRKECEICKHTFEYKYTTSCSPTCKLTEEDIMLSTDPHGNCFVILFSFVIAIGIFFVNLLTAMYLVGFVASHIVLFAIVCVFRKEMYVFNSMLFMQWVSTMGQCVFIFDIESPRFKDAMLVADIQSLCLFGFGVLWALSVFVKHSARKTLKMVYTTTINPLNDVVPRVDPAAPQAEHCARGAVQEENV